MILQASCGATRSIHDEPRFTKFVRHSKENHKPRGKMIGLDGLGQQPCIIQIRLEQNSNGHPTASGMS